MPCSRRAMLCGTLGATLAATTSGTLIGAEADRLPWRVGTGKASITPPLDVGILMSSGRRRWAPFERVRRPIWARALFLGTDQQQVALVSLDLLGLADAAVRGMDRFKQEVASASGDRVRPEQIVLTATHTHNGPETLALTDLYQTRPFEDWVSVLASRVGQTIAEAVQVACPCRMAIAARSVPGLAVNRRVLTDQGIRNPLRIPPGATVLGPEGPVDDQMRVAAFFNAGKRPVAVLVNATAHPVYEMCLPQVSPDYPGEMCLELERLRPGAGILFLQGAAGNINPPEVSTGEASAERHGRRLAQAVDEMLSGAKPVEGGPLSLVWKTLALPCRDEKGEPQETPLNVQLGALRVGPAAWVFLPGEPFVEIGLAIGRDSPCEQTSVVGYSNAYVGYVPTDTAFEHRGYETGPGRWSRFRPGAAQKMIEAARSAVRQVVS